MSDGLPLTTDEADRRYVCGSCVVRTEVEDASLCPGWQGVNYDRKLRVVVRCPECGGRGQFTRDDRGREHSLGVLAPPEPPADDRGLVPASSL